MNNKELKGIIKRLERLEKAVLRAKKKQRQDREPEGFAGLKGGLHFLIARNFFRSTRTLADTRQELEKQDYHYSSAAIQTTMNRLSKRTGPLATFREAGKKVYVRRK